MEREKEATAASVCCMLVEEPIKYLPRQQRERNIGGEKSTHPHKTIHNVPV
jgi:hypothetical protein